MILYVGAATISGALNLIFGYNLGSMMVDRLTGGRGKLKQKEKFSDLEMALISEQIQSIMPFFKEVWGESFDIETSKIVLSSGKYKHDNMS